MSENFGPIDPEDAISPAEAARMIMTGEGVKPHVESAGEETEGPIYTGREGVERSQGFEPMRVANPVKEPEPPIERLPAREPEQGPFPTEVGYYERDTGRPKPQNEVVGLDQAAADLTRWREGIGEQIEAAETQQLTDAIDQLRVDAQQQQQITEPVALDQKVQAQSEAPTGDDDRVAKALADPAILNAVQQEVGRHTAQADQIAQHYIQATAANANAAYANMLASFPELQNVRPDQLGTALQVLGQSSPEKALAIRRHIETVTKFTQEAARAQEAQQQAVAQQWQAQQQEYQRQWKVAADSHDAEWQAWTETQDGAERVKEISTYARKMLLRDMTEADLAYHWQNNPLFRSAASQRILYNAAKYEMSQKGISSKVVKDAPPVFRPGSPVERVPDRDERLHRLSARLNETGSVKDAARLLAARRRSNA